MLGRRAIYIVATLGGQPMCGARSTVIRNLQGVFLLALIGIIVIISFAGECVAQHVKIVGLGSIDCGQFIKEIEQNPGLQRDYLAWAQGYMSGILISRPVGVDEKLDLKPSTFPLLKQLEFLRAFCTEQPATDFADAVEGLYKRLRKEGASQ